MFLLSCQDFRIAFVISFVVFLSVIVLTLFLKYAVRLFVIMFCPIGRKGSGPMGSFVVPCFASWSAFSFPGMPV